jgi:hypothetical protein
LAPPSARSGSTHGAAPLAIATRENAAVTSVRRCLRLFSAAKIESVSSLPASSSTAEIAAKDDRRSLTSLIEKVLADYLTERGYLPGKPAGKRK